jgi:hypothetical protein
MQFSTHLIRHRQGDSKIEPRGPKRWMEAERNPDIRHACALAAVYVS